MPPCHLRHKSTRFGRETRGFALMGGHPQCGARSGNTEWTESSAAAAMRKCTRRRRIPTPNATAFRKTRAQQTQGIRFDTMPNSATAPQVTSQRNSRATNTQSATLLAPARQYRIANTSPKSRERKLYNAHPKSRRPDDKSRRVSLGYADQITGAAFACYQLDEPPCIMSSFGAVAIGSSERRDLPSKKAPCSMASD
jgi:hypothetical protein